MKLLFLAASSALAALLSAPPSAASLTPHNTTYDHFSMYVRMYVAKLSVEVVQADDVKLLKPFEALAEATEHGLSAETMNAEGVADAVADFYAAAAKGDPAYMGLQERVNNATTRVLITSVAAREWSDVVFDLAQRAAHSSKNQTLSTWVDAQRTAVEKLVMDGANPALTEPRMFRFLYELERSNIDAFVLMDELSGEMEAQMRREVNFDAFMQITTAKSA